MDTENSEHESVEDTPTLYTTNVEIMAKNFVNQKNGDTKQKLVVHCNEPDEFAEMLWPFVNTYIEKQLCVNQENDTYEWSHDELDHKDINKFVIIQDKTSKRTYQVDAVTRKLLMAWNTKTGVICFVHIYGTVLKTKKQYEKAFKGAIQPGVVDRAGAVNNIEVFKCIEKLKELHTDLIATEASWLRWANWIMKQAGHEREILMEQDPPSVKPSLFDLFKVARNETERLQEIRKGVEIGKRVNEGIASAIPAIEDEIDELIENFKSSMRRAERIKTYLQSLKAQLASNNNLMDGFAESLGAEEDGFSQDLLQDINNVDDIDHEQLYQSDDIEN